MNAKLLTLLLFLCGPVMAQELIDPTRPATFTKSTDGQLEEVQVDGFPTVNIGALFIRSSGNSAIVNGESVVVGQVWKGVRVIEIHAGGVVLANDEQRKEFLINGSDFKKDVSNDF